MHSSKRTSPSCTWRGLLQQRDFGRRVALKLLGLDADEVSAAAASFVESNL